MSDLLDLPAPKADRREAYGDHPQQSVDLYLPKGPGPHPLVLAFHGGFWREKYDLLHLGHLCAALAADGCEVHSVEYRRLGHEGGGFQGTLDDVSAAAAWLDSSLAPEDGQRPLVALGHSAGGQLALWLSRKHRRPRDPEHPLQNPLFAGVVALAPVSDLVEAARLGLGEGVVLDFMGGGPEDRAAQYAQASPRALLPLGVRQIVIHGTDDDTVPYSLSQAYVLDARQEGDDATLETLKGMGHFEPIDPRSAAFPVVLGAVRKLAGVTLAPAAAGRSR